MKRKKKKLGHCASEVTLFYGLETWKCIRALYGWDVVFFGIEEACSLAFQLYVRHALSHFNMSALPTNWHISILLVSEWSCFEHVASRMTANALFLKSGWITANAPLRNGVGRFIPQLARVTLKFCKAHGDSNGVRWNQFVSWIGEIESYHFEPGTHNYWVQHLGCLVWTLFSIAGELPKKSAALSQARLKSSSPHPVPITVLSSFRWGNLSNKMWFSGQRKTQAQWFTWNRGDTGAIRILPLPRGIFKTCQGDNQKLLAW